MGVTLSALQKDPAGSHSLGQGKGRPDTIRPQQGLLPSLDFVLFLWKNFLVVKTIHARF